MHKKTSFFISLLVGMTMMHACKYSQSRRANEFSFVFYNVENLFDTIDTPNKNDAEFTPASDKQWNTERYQKKLNDLSRVLAAVNDDRLPAFIGLAEIENRQVIEDLSQTLYLNSVRYAIVHEESPDRRGIDVALMYDPDIFHYQSHQVIEVVKDYDRRFKTRDILYVRGTIGKNDTLHIFINHWPSRSGGQEKSEPNRLLAAKFLRSKTDSILRKSPDADIIIAGDFNDELHNESLTTVLNVGGGCEQLEPAALYSLMMALDKEEKGTYNYRGEWNMIDNIIVSSGMFSTEKGAYAVSCDSGMILSREWMMYNNTKTGQMVPNRTYGGDNYFGGISDHLPVYVVLRRK